MAQGTLRLSETRAGQCENTHRHRHSQGAELCCGSTVKVGMERAKVSDISATAHRPLRAEIRDSADDRRRRNRRRSQTCHSRSAFPSLCYPAKSPGLSQD